MKKKFLAIFLVILLAVTSTTVCYADGASDLVNVELGEGVTNWNPDNVDDESDWNDVDYGGWGGTDDSFGIAKLVGQIVSWIFMAIMQILLSIVMIFVPHMDKIIFNNHIQQGWEGTLMVDWAEYCRLAYFDSTPSSSIASKMTAAVSSFYQTFRYLALIFFIVAIACIAVKMIISSIGKQKAQYKDTLKNWLIGLILLVVGHWIMIYLIYFSEWLVDLIVKLGSELSGYRIFHGASGGATVGNISLQTIFTAALGDAGAFTGGVLAIVVYAIVGIISLIVYAAMNIKVLKIYIERVIIVGVLIMIFPFAAVFFAFEKAGLRKGSTFESWLRTFVEQVFIQPIHALSLVFVMIALTSLPLTYSTFNIMGPIIVLMVLNMVFSIENVIKKIISVQGAAMGTPKDAMGMMAPYVMMAAGGFVRGGRNGANRAVSETTKKGKPITPFGKAMRKGWNTLAGAIAGGATGGAFDGAGKWNHVNKENGANVVNKMLSQAGFGGINGKGKDDKKDKEKLSLAVRLYKDYKANGSDASKKNFEQVFKEITRNMSSEEFAGAKSRFPNLNIGNSGDVDDKFMFLAGARCSSFDQASVDAMRKGGIDPDEQKVLIEHVLKGDAQINAEDCAKAINIETSHIESNLRILAGRFGEELRDALEKATGNAVTDLSNGISNIKTPEEYRRVVYSLAHPECDSVNDVQIDKFLDKKANS